MNKTYHPTVLRRGGRRLICGVLAAITSAVGIALPSARAYTDTDADTIFNAYNNAFYVGGGNAYYKNDTTGGHAGFWPLANEIEMVQDSYDRIRYTGTRDITTALCNGFVATNGSDWTWNSFNDDIQWACIAFARAYLTTGNTAFRDRAKANFDAMYARGWSTALGGGIFWNTSNGSKTACSNGPATIAACYLYTITGDSGYLTKAQAIYAWERSSLFNASTGAVADSIDLAGNVNTGWVFTYNMGTFIGGANYLYRLTGTRSYYTDALKATQYTRSNLCNAAGLFPASADDGSDGSLFNAIGVRWIARFVNDQNLWADFYPWLKANADAAWNVRRSSDNLSWCNWTAATATGTRYAAGCFGSVVALQVVPSSNPSPYFMLVNKATGACVDLANGSTAEGATINQWAYIYNGPNQEWALVPTENGDHFKVINLVSGKCMAMTGDSTADGAAICSYTYNASDTSHQWDLLDAANGWFKLRNVRSGKVLEVDSASTANGAKIQQWTDYGYTHQLWRLQPVGDYFIRTSNGKAVYPLNSGTANDTAIAQATRQNTASFKWRFENVSDGLYKFSNLNILGSCISVSFASTSNGAGLHLWAYSASYIDEKLRIVPKLNGSFKFYFAYDGLSWDVPYNSAVDNVVIQQWSDNTAPQQAFYLDRAP